MKQAFRSAATITIFSFSSQLVLVGVQLIAAAKFGAGSEMDAFLSASTLPQFVISVLLGSLSFVFIPFFVEYSVKGDDERAYRLSVGLFNISMLLLGTICVIGILFSRQILMVTNPGLTAQTLDVSVRISMITWPTVMATGAFTLLSSIHQAKREFAWQAVVPLIGAVVNLVLLLLLAPKLGIIGLALATTAGVVIQVFLLWGVFSEKKRYQFRLFWNEDGLRKIIYTTAPLVLVAVLTKFTPLIDRYLASEMKEGAISQLNYAFKIVTLVSVLISTGISTVIFPRMARDVSSTDMAALGSTMSLGLRIMWTVTAPVIAIGIALALPAITFLFNRGAFSVQDSLVVADLFKIYLIALGGLCLGAITGKGFYAIRDTKTLAIFGTLEAIAYVVYTVYFAGRFGPAGIAIGYVIYFSGSLCWQLIVLRLRLGSVGNLTISRSFGVTTVAAILGGVVAVGVVSLTEIILLQLLLGALAGLLVYGLILLILRSAELKMLLNVLRSGPQE
jgi:putative peptidoglycan lipid II flippase